MSSRLPSDEIAEDFKNALEALTTTARTEIQALMCIAKDLSQYAHAISRVLENHIRTAHPDKKLPALYLLDSIVKNIGIPYTTILGANIYRTFMEAYLVVPPSVRKKLDDMAKTWNYPVPQSSDDKPIFSKETMRPIETALIKARTMALQGQQFQRQQQNANPYNNMNGAQLPPAPQNQWRNTGTPPQINGHYHPPPTLPGYVQGNGHSQPNYPQHQLPNYQQTAPPAYGGKYPPLRYVPAPQPSQDLGQLHRDIENLIASARSEFTANIHDTGIQKRLKALLDLQDILKNQQLPPDQIQAIRDRVNQLSQAQSQWSVTPAAAPLPASTPLPVSLPPPSSSLYPTIPQQPVPSSVDLPSLMNPSTLADILASAAKAKQGTTAPSIPPPTSTPQYLPSNPPAQAASQPVPASSSHAMSLIDNLRAAGILGPDTSTPSDAVVSLAPSSHLFPPPQQNFVPTPPIPPSSLARPPLAEVRNDAQLSNASLKIPRPHLVKAILFNARPNQCSTCGQRFLATDDGKKRKARHLDRHFRTNQRLADSARRIQSRSWYVDEREWIKYRDNTEEDPEAGNGAESAQAQAAAAAAKNDPRNKTIPVPSDSALSNEPCPICKEKFETSWDEESQDFVWRDAVKIGPKIYHASCYAEWKKDGANTPMRTSTPDSVLGKRKAGVSDMNPARSKLPRSPVPVAASTA